MSIALNTLLILAIILYMYFEIKYYRSPKHPYDKYSFYNDCIRILWGITIVPLMYVGGIAISSYLFLLSTGALLSGIINISIAIIHKRSNIKE